MRPIFLYTALTWLYSSFYTLALDIVKPDYVPYCTTRDKCKIACSCQMATNCSVLELDDGARKSILNYHNQIRDIQSRGEPEPGGMTMLQYEDDLEQVSKCWAARCEDEYSECFITPRFNETSQAVVQITLQEGNEPKVTLLMQMMNFWLGQAKAISAEMLSDIPAGAEGEKIHNFAQLLSDRIRYVGCAWSRLDQVVTFVCSYGPRGPIQGESIYKIGRPCSLCPENYACDNVKPFSRLCKQVPGYPPTVATPPSPPPMPSTPLETAPPFPPPSPPQTTTTEITVPPSLPPFQTQPVIIPVPQSPPTLPSVVTTRTCPLNQAPPLQLPQSPPAVPEAQPLPPQTPPPNLPQAPPVAQTLPPLAPQVAPPMLPQTPPAVPQSPQVVQPMLPPVPAQPMQEAPPMLPSAPLDQPVPPPMPPLTPPQGPPPSPPRVPSYGNVRFLPISPNPPPIPPRTPSMTYQGTYPGYQQQSFPSLRSRGREPPFPPQIPLAERLVREDVFDVFDVQPPVPPINIQTQTYLPPQPPQPPPLPHLFIGTSAPRPRPSFEQSQTPPPPPPPHTFIGTPPPLPKIPSPPPPKPFPPPMRPPYLPEPPDDSDEKPRYLPNIPHQVLPHQFGHPMPPPRLPHAPNM